MATSEPVVVLEIEVPAIYTADIEGLLAEFRDHFESESECLLNTIGEPSVVRLRTELAGDKDSDVVEVWGHVRGARLAEPSKGIDEDWLADNGYKLMREEDGCEHCTLAVVQEEGNDRGD